MSNRLGVLHNFRFTIREVFLMITIVGILLGWWMQYSMNTLPLYNEVKLLRWKSDTLGEILERGGYSIEFSESSITASGPNGTFSYSRGSTWRKSLTGKPIMEWD